MKKLFALLMALTMTVQLVTPAWADAVEEGPEESTEAVEVVQETTEATEETEVPEETEAETEETEATEEVTEPESEAGEEAAAKVRVRFACTPEDLTLVVFPADGDVDQAIDAEEDGSYLLTAGEYGYLAEAEGYEAAEGSFTVMASELTTEIVLSKDEDITEEETFGSSEGRCGNNAYWSLNSDGMLRISGTGAIYDYEIYPISERAPWYSERDAIKNIFIEDGITIIGTNVFCDCDKWKRCYVPDSVTEIKKSENQFYSVKEESVFLCGHTQIPSSWGSNWSQKGTVATGVTREQAIFWMNLGKEATRIAIPDGVQEIFPYAFQECGKLEYIDIPGSVTTLRKKAFAGTSLRMIFIPETVTTIYADRYASPFYGCPSDLVCYCESDTEREGWQEYWNYTIGDYLRVYYGISREEYDFWPNLNRNVSEIEIPEGITIIPYKAFFNKAEITRISLPSTVKKIDNLAFAGCTGLRSFYIPKTVIYISAGSTTSPFYGCDSSLRLYTGFEEIPDTWDYYYRYYERYEQLKISLHMGPKDYEFWITLDKQNPKIVIDEGVESIPDYAFQNNMTLKEVVFPSTMRKIPKDAFYGCSSLTKVELPDTIEEVGYGAFSNCASLTYVKLSQNLQTLGAAMFSGATALKEIDLEYVKRIEDGAFHGCSGLQYVFIPKSVETIGKNAFVTEAQRTWLFCEVEERPDSWDRGWNINEYSTDRNAEKWTFFGASREDAAFWPNLDWNMQSTQLVIPEGVTAMPKYLGDMLPNLQSISIPGTVKEIGETAFGSHKHLTTVKIGNGVQKIGKMAFFSTPLTEIYLPDGLEEMGEMAFYGSKNLKEVRIPGSLKTIKHETFMNCTSLRNVTLEDGIEKIEYDAFEGCSGIREMVIPASARYVAPGFIDRNSPIRIEYKGTMQQWAAACAGLPATCSDGYLIDSGTCGDLNVSIGEKVNWYITKSGKGYSLTIFGDGAIGDRSDADKVPWAEYRDDIVEATVMEGVTKIGECAFWGCTKLSKITLPESLEWINQYAFSWCHSLKTIAIPKNVDTIGYQAFWDCYNLTSINFLHEQDDSLFLNEEAFITQSKQVTTKIRVPDVKRVNEAIKGYSWKSDHRTVSYGYNDCLPKVEKITLWKDEQQINGTINLDIADAEELSLHAVLEPAGALQQVIWASSSSAVATVSNEGEVKLIKPGTTTISASAVDGSKLSAKVTLNVIYRDGAKTLTLRSDAPAVGLQMGKTAQMTLSGDKAISAEYVDFSIPAEQSAIASVDSNGTITAGTTSGTVTVTAALRGDPLGRKATLKLNVIPKQAQAVRVTVENPDNLGQFIQGETNATFSLDMDVVRETDRQFPLVVESLDDEGNWTKTSRILYTSSDSAIASVGTDGALIIKKASSGECVIRIQSDDLAKVETQLRVIVEDKAPRLDSNKLTLNSNLTAGTTTALVESYNNTIQSVTLYDYNKTTKIYESTPSETFAAEAEDGTLTVRALGAQSSGTYQLKLVVTCLGGSYDYTLQVKVANSLPKVTVKQIGKFDTFYLDSTARLTATASGYEVEWMELIGADTFRMDEDGNIFYAESYNPGDKVVTKGTLLVYVEGYQVPVKKNVTVATTKTAPKLTLNPSASAINRVMEDPECRVKVLWKGNALNLTDAEVTPDVGFATVEAQGQCLVFRLTGATGGTAKLSLRLPNWAQAVSLTHKITVDTKLPTVKLGVTTLKLNSLFSAQTARTSVWLTQGNLDISTMDFKAAREEGKCIDLSFDPETDSIEAKFKGIPKAEMPKAGTYSYTYTAYLENGTALPNGTIKVTVAATAPKVKLSAASVKLNRYLAGQEKATVKVTLTGGTGYQVTDFEGLPDYMRYDAETSELTVVLPDETFTGETCNLYPIVREEESGQEVHLSTKLTLKVRTLNTTKLTVSLSAKGKLNTVDPDSAIAYTVTKVNNCLGTVESVDLVDQNGDSFQDGDPFQADLDTSGVKPIVLLRLLPGKSYATNKTYKVRFRFTVCGEEVLSSVLSVKVTQTALKVTAPKTAVYYLSQSGPLRCSLKANLPLESVALSTRTAKEFQQALGGQENLRMTGNRVEFKLTNPGALTAGKSYSVQLELTPENAAENTKPTTIKLTVKVMK